MSDVTNIAAPEKIVLQRTNLSFSDSKAAAQKWNELSDYSEISAIVNLKEDEEDEAVISENAGINLLFGSTFNVKAGKPFPYKMCSIDCTFKGQQTRIGAKNPETAELMKGKKFKARTRKLDTGRVILELAESVSVAQPVNEAVLEQQEG